jgi:hypothetical protein
MSVSTSAALLHPPSIVHFRSSSSDFPSLEEDDCSTISSAPNSPGRVSGEDSDESEGGHSPPSLPSDPLLSSSGGVLQLALRMYPSELQRKNSELGRQSRKSRLRRASLKLIHQKKQDGYIPDDRPATLLEEKKSADDESPSSSVDARIRSHKKRHCSEEETLERPEDRNILDHSTCSSILHSEDIDTEEGDDLPLLPRHKKNAVMLQEEREYSTSSSTTVTRDPSSSSTTRLMTESPPLNDDDSSPMDEVDELEFPAALERSEQRMEQHLLFDQEPPSLQIPSTLAVADTTSLQLHNSRPALVWKESESFDDDLDLVMSPTDEMFGQYPSHLDPNTNHHDVIRETDQHVFCGQSFNEDSTSDEVPIDEQFHMMSLMQSHNDSDDIPPIARVQNHSLQRRPISGMDSPGSCATNAIAVEDLVDWTKNHAVEDDTNPLDVSHDSSTTSGVGPLIRLEQHQPLLLQSLDEFSSSDETPLAGNGPVTRAHGSSSRIRKRMYGEPRLHDYWKSKQLSANRPRRHRTRRVSVANVKYSNSSALSASTKQMDEGSLDRMLPPLIIDPEQLRSIGITAIVAVCNGIGSLFLSNGEVAESPKEKKVIAREPYKLLSKDEKETKKRTRGKKYKDMSRQVLDDLTQTEASLSSSALRHPIDDNMLLNATPLYFEAALQRSIDAELRAGDARFTSVSKSQSFFHSRLGSTMTQNHLSKSSEMEQVNYLVEQKFADFRNGLHNLDISDPPNQISRTRSVPVSLPSCSREVVDLLWMEEVRAIKNSSNKLEPMPALKDEGRPIGARSTPVPDDEKESVGIPKIELGIMERISAIRRSKESPNPESTNVVTASASEDNLCSPSPAMVCNDDRNPLLSPVTPVIDQRRLCDMSPVDHTPLAGPPPLRRLNVSLDFQDSFGPDFSTQVLDMDEPPSLIRSKKVTSEELSSADVAKKPSANRSPMSDFLLLRLQASSSDMSSTDLQNPKVASADRTNSADDSDCSSTEELVNSLDGLVRDLDGMANSRRIERKQTSDSQSSDSILFQDLPLLNENMSPEKISSAKLSDFNVIGLPLLVDLLTNDLGIPTGDIMISLLNTEQVEPAFRSRVDESIWRSRTMRHLSDVSWLDDIRERKSVSFPNQRRTSVCVDVDDVRVMGGIEKLADTQRVALEYLKFDDFDDALVLYDDICLSYEQFTKDLYPSDERQMKNHLATAQFNLGIVHSLRGEQDEALDFFENSTQLFSDSCGARHIAHVVSS